jgi:hypothetical protein
MEPFTGMTQQPFVLTRRQFATSIAGGLAAAPAFSSQDPVVLREFATSAQLEGSVAISGAKQYVVWKGPGSAVWNVEIERPGDYYVAVGYACGKPGSRLTLSSGDARITTVTRPIKGFFNNDVFHPIDDFELVPLEGRLKLRRGKNQLALTVSDPQTPDPLAVCWLELTPVDGVKRVAAEVRRARAARSSTDWFVKSAYGVMFHWTGQSQPRYGAAKPYAEAVRDFPVSSFVDSVRQTGAGHVIFTVSHSNQDCPAPIRSWEKYHPGRTTDRDLIGELAEGLHQAGVRLILYMNLVGAFSPNDDSKQFVEKCCDVLEEIGHRYGRKLDGYWFDGWNGAYKRYHDVRQDLVFRACKAGNPDRITAFNFWVLPVCTEWQEYWAGEVISPTPIPTSRYIGCGANRSLQSHFLLFLDAPWVHSKPNTEMESPRFPSEKIVDYVDQCAKRQAVVTINLGIYQDGIIGPKALEYMSAVRRRIRGS